MEVMMERRGEVVKLIEEKKKAEINKATKEQEEQKKSDENLKEIKKTKTLEYYFDSLKTGNYVFLKNDRSKIFKIKKIVKDNKKIEFVLSDSTAEKSNEIRVDPFKCKLSQFTSVKCMLVWFDDRVMERNARVNINSSISEAQEKIVDQIKNFVKSPDIRIIYKGEDIFYKAINYKVYCGEKGEEKKILNKSTDESFNLDIFFGEEEQHQEESDNQESKIIDNNEETKENKEKRKESEELSIAERLAKAKNLCELGFNFLKDHLVILIPENPNKLCNLFKFGSYDYTSGWRNLNFVNLYIFNNDLKIRNFSICGAYEKSKFNSIDFLIFESNFKKQKYEKEKESLGIEKYDINEMLEYEFWKKHRLIYEQKDLVLNQNFENESENPLEKITNRAYIVNTEMMEFSKDKIYSFVFKLKENSNGDYMYYYTRSLPKFFENVNGDFDILGYTNKNTYFFLYGFDYSLK